MKVSYCCCFLCHFFTLSCLSLRFLISPWCHSESRKQDHGKPLAAGVSTGENWVAWEAQPSHISRSHLQSADLPISFRSSLLNTMAVTSSGEVRNRQSWLLQRELKSLNAYSKETGSAVTSRSLYAAAVNKRYDCYHLPVTRYCKNKPSAHSVHPF